MTFRFYFVYKYFVRLPVWGEGKTRVESGIFNFSRHGNSFKQLVCYFIYFTEADVNLLQLQIHYWRCKSIFSPRR
jgi:hypothetical protein